VPTGDPAAHSVPPPDPDEASLLAGLRAGDETAYARLVTLHGGRMLAVARRLLGNEDEARDALQEAFVAAYRNLDGFAGQARLSTWLHRIVVNAALMRIRRRRARPEEPIEPLLPVFLADGHQATPAVTWGATAEQLVARREIRVLVRRAIDRLPPTYRTVLVLRDLEELDTGEVAARLGISPNAVKIRLHRARQALRGLLDPHLRGVSA
jgi:RNA polymerase sigma-70 factor (ECF subfamily)